MDYMRKITAIIFTGILLLLMMGCCSLCEWYPMFPWCQSCPQSSVEIDLGPKENRFQITKINDDVLTIDIALSAIHVKDIYTKGGKFLKLESEGLITTFGEGEPNLPVFSRLIEVPLDATLECSVLSSSDKFIDLKGHGFSNKILPAQPSLSISDDTRKVAFYYDKTIYNKDEFMDEDFVSDEDLGVLRSSRLFRIEIKPIQYNPSANKLKIKNEMKIGIKFKDADHENTKKMKEKYSSPLFDHILKKAVSNFQLKTATRPPPVHRIVIAGTLALPCAASIASAFLPVTSSAVPLSLAQQTPETTTGGASESEASGQPITYVIISHKDFKDTIKPFIDHKKKLGYKVIDAYTSDIAAYEDNPPKVGCTKESIKEYLQEIYVSQPYDYLLLIGDVKQIPSFNYTTKGTNNSPIDHETDLYYANLSNEFFADEDGSIPFPCVFYGRLSANNEEELKPQIAKTLAYEESQKNTSSHVFESVLIAGHDNRNRDIDIGNKVIHYVASNYFNLSNNTTHIFLQPSSDHGGNYRNRIKEKISSGVGFVHYFGHSAWDGWSDPSFKCRDIRSDDIIAESNKWGLWIGNCCYSSLYSNRNYNEAGEEDVPCFGEVALREGNKGAVGYIGASNKALWNETQWWAIGTPRTAANESLTEEASNEEEQAASTEDTASQPQANEAAAGETSSDEITTEQSPAGGTSSTDVVSTPESPNFENTGPGAFDGLFHAHGEDSSKWYSTQGQVVHAGNLSVTGSTSAPANKTYYWEIFQLLGDPSLSVFPIPSNITQVNEAGTEEVHGGDASPE